MRRGIESQAGAEQIEFSDVGGDAPPLPVGFRARLLGQSIDEPAACVGNGTFQLLLKGRERALRKEQAVHDGGADDTERDLLDTRHRGFEYRARREYTRKA